MWDFIVVIFQSIIRIEDPEVTRRSLLYVEKLRSLSNVADWHLRVLRMEKKTLENTSTFICSLPVSQEPSVKTPKAGKDRVTIENPSLPHPDVVQGMSCTKFHWVTRKTPPRTGE